MNAVAKLLAEMLALTIVFAFFFTAAIMATTVTFQSHIHPDEWKTTAYDIAAGAFVVIAYVAMLARMVYIFLKARSIDQSRKHN
jgi:hypothetical protein